MKSRTIRIVLGLYFLINSCVLWGHRPDVSTTMLVEQTEGKWIFQIKAALTAFEYEVEQYFSNNAYATPQEFEQLVLQLIQENIFIFSDNKDKVILQNPYIKLGHETNVVFEVVGMPLNIESLSISNRTFQHISQNQSALFLIKKDFEKQQFVLNEINHHKVDLKVEGNQFVLVDVIASTSTNSYIIGGIVLGLVLIFAILFLMNKIKF